MFYFKTLAQILRGPRRFFSENLPDTGWRFAAGFLVISSVVFTGASLLSFEYADPWSTGSILFLNALGMVLISSSLGYMIMTMSIGRKASFGSFFSVYALSSGVTLLASWMPFSLLLTESWRWWLIGTGLTRGCGVKGRQAFWIIVASIVVMVGGVMSVMAIISHLGSINA